MVARELEGDEREQWYERGIEIYPGWVQYRKRAPRQIPVIELAAAGASGARPGPARRQPARRVLRRRAHPPRRGRQSQARVPALAAWRSSRTRAVEPPLPLRGAPQVASKRMLAHPFTLLAAAQTGAAVVDAPYAVD